MIESVRKNMPCAEIIQLSDDETHAIANVDHVYRFGSTPDYLMPARMSYQFQFLRRWCRPDEKVIFIDPDIIIQHDISHVFDEYFDIGLTWRANLGKLSDQMPFNAGVVFVRNTEGGWKFWLKASNMLAKAPENLKIWYGDQLAMIELVGRENYKNRTNSIINGIDTVYKMIPCEDYNYSPISDELLRALNVSGECKTLDRLRSKNVLHFKGGLKDYMCQYCELI